MWCSVISMTTVGYGETVAATPMGRFITIILILAGSYIMSIVIAVQASFFSLSE